VRRTGGKSGEAVTVKAGLLTDAAGVVATSDASGRLWLYVETDSGHEGHTALHYLHGMATLTPQ